MIGEAAELEIAGVLGGITRWSIAKAEAFQAISSLPDACADAFITDPPYSSGGQFRGDRAGATALKKYVQTGTMIERPDFAGDNRDQRSFLAWCTLWLGEALRATKPGGMLVVFSDWRQLPIVTDAVQAGGWVWRGIAAWDKTEGCRPQMGRFRAQCEYMIFATAGAADEARDLEVGVLPGCFRHPVVQNDKHHVTGKPTALMLDVVRACRPGGLIVDPFAGSGTTLLAALRTGRRALGFELTDEYSALARERLSADVEGRDFRNPGQISLLG